MTGSQKTKRSTVSRRPRRKSSGSWRGTLTGFGLCLLVGLGAWATPIGQRLVMLSYDLQTLFQPRHSPNEVVVVYMDDKSFQELKQSPASWDRREHAKLLNQMTRDQARLVVFDINFIDPAPEDSNQIFAEAIRRNGRVVLASKLETTGATGIVGEKTIHPLQHFRTNATASGIAAVVEDKSTIVRQDYQGTPDRPDIVSLAVQASHPSLANKPGKTRERWLRYYGPFRTLPYLSYSDVAYQTNGYFKDRIVFIGAGIRTPYTFDEAEEFRSPYSFVGEALFPGVTLLATAYLNQIRGEALIRQAPMLEGLLLIGAALLFGTLLRWAHPVLGAIVALISMVLVAVLGCWVGIQNDTWIPWTIPAAIQIPLAYLWGLICFVQEARRDKEVLLKKSETVRDEIKQLLQDEISSSETPTPVSDHTLIRAVARGAYGEVWLAKNAIGVFHAVKIVRFDAFQDPVPYEREFQGIQTFMPISRSHQNWVHILHVGQNERERFFYYVMEVADDVKSGQKIDPDHYKPKTLASVLAEVRILPASECLLLMTALTEALERLHQKNLIHRDIKPANIIYVGGVPKLADIGLVTQQADQHHEVSFLGTEGYIAPEGPGEAAADIFSLGRVMYSAALGLPPDRFPELPEEASRREDSGLLLKLNTIIGQACDPDLEFRYHSTTELLHDLNQLQTEFGEGPTQV